MTTNPMAMEGRTVLVTGASSGIGRDTSRLLSELSARVILVGRNVGRLEDTALSLVGNDHRIEPFDLTMVDQIPGWLKQIAGRVGPLDGLVHSAGIGGTLPIRSWVSTFHDNVLRVNVSASMALAQGFRQQGAHKTPASLVFISSVAGLVGTMGLSVYSASKGAVGALTKSLALEMARDGIRVNCVAPGTVATEMVIDSRRLLGEEQFARLVALHPLGIGRPRDIACAIAFLLADTSRWITGTSLIVDGGYTAQ